MVKGAGRVRAGPVLALGLLLAFDLLPSTFDLPPTFDLPQASVPHYAARHLACAAFLEDVRTAVTAQQGLTPVREQGHRAGVLVVRAAAAGAALRFEAWYDSLTVWHETAAGRATPDTDGLVGGRWRGTLTGAGEVALEVRPFMPPALAAVADLSDVPLDFLPPLPREPLAPGARWAGPDHLVVERLADSAGASRYRWRVESAAVVAGAGADSGVTLRQDVEDEGRLAWTEDAGVAGWSREVRITTWVSAGPRVRTAAQGRVEQRITVRRLPPPAGCR